MKKINIKSIGDKIVAGVKYKMEDFTWLKLAQLFIVVIMLINLVYADIYNDALLKLERNISGFKMFCFVLCSIIAAVFSIRIEPGVKSKVIIALLSVALVLICGYLLVWEFQYGLTQQTAITDASKVVVQKGLNFLYVMMAGFGISFVAIAATAFKKPKKLY
ncbi:MAG: hypothetical protein R3Y65_03235 [Bacillota bacterium]